MAKLPSKQHTKLRAMTCAATRLSRTICYFPLTLWQTITAAAENSSEVELTPAGISCPVAPDQGDGLGVRKSNAVGGQAVIEGVMMRAKTSIACAVRAPDQRIVCRIQELPKIFSGSWAKKPIIRGATMLFETLKIGIGTLDWSAKIASSDEPERKEKFFDKVLGYLSIPIAFLLAMALFLWFPYWVAKATIGADGNQFLYHIVANGVRISLLVGYMYVISLSKEVRRVFEYHGAEHKGIAAYEAGAPVTPETMKEHTRFHARCGTSFLLVLAIVTMVFFAVFDGSLQLLGYVFPNALVRVLAHLPFVPLVAGIGYEVLKLSDRKKSLKIVSALIQPGLWLQRITTREPDFDQLAVSAVSLRTAIMGKIPEMENVVAESDFKPLAS